MTSLANQWHSPANNQPMVSKIMEEYKPSTNHLRPGNLPCYYSGGKSPCATPTAPTAASFTGPSGSQVHAPSLVKGKRTKLITKFYRIVTANHQEKLLCKNRCGNLTFPVQCKENSMELRQWPRQTIYLHLITQEKLFSQITGSFNHEADN